MAENAVAAISSRQLEFLAAQLGVSSQSLAQLRVGWSFKHGAFTVPEVDGERQIIGVALRWPTGRKGFIRHGMRGLTVPAILQGDGRVFVVEGMSDVAALSDHGIAAVGRPCASGGIGHLAGLLADRAIVVVGEHNRKPDGRWPGRAGAMAVTNGLRKALNREVMFAMPPSAFKDVRAWLRGLHP